MSRQVEAYPYVFCELLSADPIVDVESGESRVGITVSSTDGEDSLSVCLSVPDAMRLARQLNESLITLAEEG